MCAHAAVEQLGREHLPGQRIHPLKSNAPGTDHVAPTKEHFQARFHVGPPPPRPAALVRVVLDLAGPHRPLRGQLGEQPVEHRPIRLGPDAGGAGRQIAVVLHPPPQQRPGVERHERRLVRPVLRVTCLPAGAEPVELGLVIATEPAERGQVVTALEHIDRVDLQQSEPVDQRIQLTDAGSRHPDAAEALRCQGNAASQRG